jgi:hypothetical protein
VEVCWGGAAAHTSFTNLSQPFCPIARCVHLLAGTRNRPTPVDRFQATHHACQIPRDRQITARQFLQSSYAMLSVIDRLKLVPVQQFGQFARVVAIILVLYSILGCFFADRRQALAQREA